MVVLLLITFIAWSLDITWLFFGLLILFILTSGSVAISVITLLGVGALYLLNLKDYWFIALFGIVAVILLVESRKKQPKGEEYYSPELMQLLGGVE